MNEYIQMSNTIKFRKMFSLINNETQISEYIQSINESLKSLLMTSKGELLGDINYGTNLLAYVFSDNDPTVLNDLLATELSDAINTYETRVYVTPDNIYFYNENNRIYINIRYLIKKTDSIEDLIMLIGEMENNDGNI